MDLAWRFKAAVAAFAAIRSRRRGMYTPGEPIRPRSFRQLWRPLDHELAGEAFEKGDEDSDLVIVKFAV